MILAAQVTTPMAKDKISLRTPGGVAKWLDLGSSLCGEMVLKWFGCGGESLFPKSLNGDSLCYYAQCLAVAEDFTFCSYSTITLFISP